MKHIFFFIPILLLSTRCTENKSDKSKAERNNHEPSVRESEERSLSECDIVYDTITNEKYRMHLAIIDKFNNKEKRGYVRDAKGDTLNSFLYHQDISVFANSLDSNETGIYKKLTNKVVFLILENEPKMLDYGLTVWTNKLSDLDYFMYHVAHPNCNTLPIEQIKKRIEKEMRTPTEEAKEVKRKIIESLAENQQ